MVNDLGSRRMSQADMLQAVVANYGDESYAFQYADWLEEQSVVDHDEVAFYRRGCQFTGNQFNQSIIAQDDDEDYEESGYVVCIRYGLAFLGSYGHCSCYDTWSSMTGGGISDYREPDDYYTPGWAWVGTIPELLTLARGKLDPVAVGRVASPEDRDYDHLMKVYEQVLQWAAREGKQ